jgi:ElaB/YqjD/DUF883 family membrane-anchored ribosome-binding protein
MAADFSPAGGLGSQSRPKDSNEQIAELRTQVEQLMRERVTPAMGDVAARAGEAAQQAREFAQKQVDTVATTISERPLTAVAIAIGIGYCLGRGTR